MGFLDLPPKAAALESKLVGRFQNMFYLPGTVD